MAPAVARTASAIATPVSAPVFVFASKRSIHVPFVGAVVVSVAPDAVVGSVAASNALAVYWSPIATIATISSPATAVLKVPVCGVLPGTPCTAEVPVS